MRTGDFERQVLLTNHNPDNFLIGLLQSVFAKPSYILGGFEQAKKNTKDRKAKKSVCVLMLRNLVHPVFIWFKWV